MTFFWVCCWLEGDTREYRRRQLLHERRCEGAARCSARRENIDVGCFRIDAEPEAGLGGLAQPRWTRCTPAAAFVIVALPPAPIQLAGQPQHHCHSARLCSPRLQCVQTYNTPDYTHSTCTQHTFLHRISGTQRQHHHHVLDRYSSPTMFV